MSCVFQVGRADPGLQTEALDSAAEAIAAGLLVVIPTETVHGIACRPDDPAATRKLFEAKRRPTGLNLPVLCPTEGAAWEIAVPNDAARRLAKAFWPGPLTMVLNRTERSMPWELGEDGDTIGVRVPGHPLCLSLLARVGPLAATSANISGQTPNAETPELVRTFADSVEVFIIEALGADGAVGSASTVVDLTAEPIRLLREGAIGAAQVLRAATG